MERFSWKSEELGFTELKIFMCADAIAFPVPKTDFWEFRAKDDAVRMTEPTDPEIIGP